MLNIAKLIPIQHNLTIQVIDVNTHRVVQEHTGHNMATNTLLTGIARYLKGDGVLNQGSVMLQDYLPQYMSLGTLGLADPYEDSDHLPTGLGDTEASFNYYLQHAPGYGSDGYNINDCNNREVFGLGDPVTYQKISDYDEGTLSDYPTGELYNASLLRPRITFRDVIPENKAEFKHTVDVVYQTLFTQSWLKGLRGNRDYIFITECGLWSKRVASLNSSGELESGFNGLLAGYRIGPSSEEYSDMSIEANRTALKSQIIRVDKNQVVQLIWKIQLGAPEAFYNVNYDHQSSSL